MIEPMPADFAPIVTTEVIRGATVWVWRATVPIDGRPTQLEYGLRHDDLPAMRLAIWQILEHARLGNHEHVSHARADRHSRRPRLTKGLPPPTLAAAVEPPSQA